MKVALAAMVYAAGALTTVAFPGRLRLVFTADEEAGSTLGSRWLVENSLVAGDAMIIGEPGGINAEWEAIHLVSRGVALFRVKVRGTQMHSSISDRLPAVNASVQMARLMSRMDAELRGRIRFEPHPLCATGPTVNVGVTVNGGVYFGVYPGMAEFGCDIRTLPGMTEERLVEDVQRFLDEAMADEPSLDAELEWVTMMPACEISPDEPVVVALQSAVSDVIGAAPRLDAFPGATDAAYFRLGADIPTVASVGPGLLPRAHSPNEHLAAEGAHLASRVFALACWRYLSRGVAEETPAPTREWGL
jgi:acetylornithine deacetylase